MDNKVIKLNHFFIKVFKNKEFADNFLKLGQIHFEEFKTFRAPNNDYRNDPDEGLFVINKGTYWDAETKETKEVEIKIFQNKFHSLCCFFTFNPFEQEVNTNESTSFLSEKMKQFGDHAVLIYDATGFINKLQEYINNNPNKFDVGFVEYIRERKRDTFYTPYQKIDTYKYQNEFRILSKKQKNLDNLGNIEIGDLSRYGKLCKVDDLFKIEFHQ